MAEPLNEQAIRQAFSTASYKNDLSELEELFTNPQTRACLLDKQLTLGLNSAVRSGDLRLINDFLSAGAPMKGACVYAYRTENPHTLAILKVFLEHGWDVNEPVNNKGLITLGNIFLRSDSEELAKCLLDNGANPNAVDKEGVTVIRKAAWSAPPVVVRLLISHGAKLNGTGALHMAAYRGKDDDSALEITNILLDEGYDINEREWEGHTDIPSNDWTRDKGTALHVAAEKGILSRVQLLVDRGADLNRRSLSGYTAKDWAQINENEEVRSYLEGVMRERGFDADDIEVPENLKRARADPYTRSFIRLPLH